MGCEMTRWTEEQNTRMKTKAEVEAYFSGDKIECLICGKWFRSLAKHIVSIHGVSVNDYKTKFNLPWGRGLVSNDARVKYAESAQKRIAEGDTPFVDFINNPRIMNKAHQAKKRNFRDYDIKRVIMLSHKVKDTYRKETEKKANEILKRMEHERIPACYVCMLPDVPGYHNLVAACRKNKSIRQRYEQLKASLPSMIEVRYDTTREEIKQRVMGLRTIGKTTREIAKDIGIGATTVKRIIRNEGAWKK
jgi:hypothetical protein